MTNNYMTDYTEDEIDYLIEIFSEQEELFKEETYYLGFEHTESELESETYYLGFKHTESELESALLKN